jgi:O-antigen/teichoic acid export membrane protein
MAQSRTFKVAVLASGKLLTTCVGIITFAVLSRLFAIQDYATYRQTILAYTFAAPFLMLGLPEALYYFLPGERKRSRSVLVENLLLLGFMGGLFSVFLFFGGNRFLAWRFNNPDLEQTLRILAPYPLFLLPVSALSACLMARDRVKQVAVFNVLSRAIMLVMVIAFSLIWRTPVAAIIGTVIGAAIVLLPALKLMFASCAEGPLLPSRAGMWSQLNYSVPLGMAGLVGSLILNLNKVVVSSICSPSDFAIYINGAMEIPLVGILALSLKSVLLPEFVYLYKSEQYDKIIEVWKTATVKCASIFVPVMVFLFAMAPQVMRVLFSAKYEAAAFPFRVLLLLLMMRSMNLDVIFLSTNHNKLILARGVVSLCANLVGSIIFVKRFGYIGAPFSLVLVAYFWSIPFTLIFISRILKKEFLTVFPFLAFGKILLISVISAGVFMLNLYLDDLPDVVSVGLFSILYFPVTLFLFHIVGIMNIRDFLNMIIERKLKL